MKVQSLFFYLLVFVFFSCGSTSKEKAESTLAMSGDALISTEAVAIDTVSENYMLLKNQCLICHGGAPSHDELIAPPMAAVKWRYSKQYDKKEDFVKALIEWGLNPSEETALMRGAVNQFKVMPKPAASEADLKTIATFIYDNQLEQPEWFEEHFKEMHGEKGNGMGGGMGKGKQ